MLSKAGTPLPETVQAHEKILEELRADGLLKRNVTAEDQKEFEHAFNEALFKEPYVRPSQEQLNEKDLANLNNRENHYTVREYSLQNLLAQNPIPAEALEIAAGIIADKGEDIVMRHSAARELAGVGQAGSQVLPILEDMIRREGDGNVALYCMCIAALAAAGDAKSVAIVKKISESAEDSAVRYAAENALKKGASLETLKQAA